MKEDQERQDLVMKPHVHLSMAVPELGWTFHSTQPIHGRGCGMALAPVSLES